MAAPYLLSSPPNTHRPYHHLPRRAPTFPSHQWRLPQKTQLPTSTVPLSSPLRASKPSRPPAAVSSFAESDGAAGEEQESDGLPGMAQAFHISSRTASAISVCIAAAALSLPFVLEPMSRALGLKAKLLAYATLLLGFYMAWNIGANDVANAMGTSVVSGALTLRQAVVTAAVLEFSGALLMGKHVTSTMQKGILVANVFQGKDMLLFAGLLSSLAAAGTWLQVASYYGWPVSTTHCIVGSMVGLLSPMEGQTRCFGVRLLGSLRHGSFLL